MGDAVVRRLGRPPKSAVEPMPWRVIIEKRIAEEEDALFKAQVRLPLLRMLLKELGDAGDDLPDQADELPTRRAEGQ